MSIKLVQKSSGYRQKFDVKKLTQSITRTLSHAGTKDERLAERIAHETLEYLEGKGDEIINTEDIRETVIRILEKDGLKDVVREYELISLHLPDIKLKTVIKRSGKKEPFHAHKLFKALRKSFDFTNVTGGKLAEELTREVIERIERKYPGAATVNGEEIRRLSAELLKERNFKSAEKYYLLRKYL